MVKFGYFKISLYLIFVLILFSTIINCSSGDNDSNSDKNIEPPKTHIVSDLTFTDSELQQGFKIIEDEIQFGFPKSVAEEAINLGSSVKSFKHHGEYYGVHNWDEKREGKIQAGSSYFYIIGTNVYAQDPIELSIFLSDEEGLICDAWGNEDNYEFGVAISDADEEQLADSGPVPNWIGLSLDDKTKWVIKTTKHGGDQDTQNISISLDDLKPLVE